MFNFIKKRNNAHVDLNEQSTGVRGEYNATIERIKQLEGELTQSSKAQSIMCESMKNCAASLYLVKSQLKGIAESLDDSNKQVSELILENQALKASSDEWFRRAIKLEFEALTANDKLKKIENQTDLALKNIECLKVELMAADKENNRCKD